MNVATILGFAVVWFVAGILAAGIEIAFHQKEYPSIAHLTYKTDITSSYIFGLALGPIALFINTNDYWMRTKLPENGVQFW